MVFEITTARDWLSIQDKQIKFPHRNSLLIFKQGLIFILQLKQVLQKNFI